MATEVDVVDKEVEAICKLMDVIEEEYERDKDKWWNKCELYKHPSLSNPLEPKYINMAIEKLLYKGVIEKSYDGKIKYLPPLGE